MIFQSFEDAAVVKLRYAEILDSHPLFLSGVPSMILDWSVKYSESIIANFSLLTPHLLLNSRHFHILNPQSPSRPFNPYSQSLLPMPILFPIPYPSITLSHLYLFLKVVGVESDRSERELREFDGYFMPKHILLARGKKPPLLHFWNGVLTKC